MTKKRRLFDVDLPADDPHRDAIPDDLETKSMTGRRGPMATAIGEAGSSLRRREAMESDVRAENDALAHEFVRVKRLGLIVDRVPVDLVRTRRLVRDRSRTADLDLEGLKTSIRAVGLSNPIRVVQDGAGGFDLVQGLRRLTAYRELFAETGDDVYASIPAGLMPAGETTETLYRRMVDENLIRLDVSFAEMANLARAYVEEAEECPDLDMAVNRLYASASPQKRSYIRRFAYLMQALEKVLEHPAAIPRALGLQLADRIEADPGLGGRLVAALQTAGRRDADGELAVLRAFAAGQGGPMPAKVRGAPRGQRRGRMSLVVPTGPGAGVRCTATDGRIELRAEMDFATLDRDLLEAAIEAFFAALERR